MPPFLSYMVMILIHAYALPIATSIVKGWTRLHTMAAPERERQDRRAQVLSDLHDQKEVQLSEGLTQTDAAVRLLFRMVLGIKDDVAWCAPYLPTTLAEGLERGSDALTSFRTPELLIPSLASVGMMNCVYFWEEVDKSWLELLAFNCAAFIAIVFMWNRKHLWACRVSRPKSRVSPSTVALIVTPVLGLLVLFVLQHRLYQVPHLYNCLLAIASLLLVGALTLKAVRVRVFNGRLWPVFLCGVLIVAALLVVAHVLTGSATTLLIIWEVAVLMSLMLIGVLAILAICSAAVWYGGLRVSSGAMRLAATCIRHLI